MEPVAAVVDLDLGVSGSMDLELGAGRELGDSIEGELGSSAGGGHQHRSGDG